MEKNKALLIVVGVMMIVTATIGSISYANSINKESDTGISINQSNANRQWNNDDRFHDFNMMGSNYNTSNTNANYGNFNMMGSNYNTSNTNANYGNFNMMGSVYDYGESDSNSEKVDIEILKENVENYIQNYSVNLEISDIFIFEDGDYYFSIIETDTGRGAMELLVNPVTGDIYPEFGPNMMWNLKYGMHGSSQGMMGYGMSGNRGMMGGSGTRSNQQNINSNEQDELSYEEAYNIGNEYIKMGEINQWELSEESHQFYGYYTFHVEEGKNTIGMLSVNAYTGEVWFHDWHGTVSQIIEGH